MKKQLINCDSIDWIENTNRIFHMGFADPPDAIGLGYNGFKDDMNDEQYYTFMRRMLTAIPDRFSVFWLSFNAKHTPLIGHLTYHFLGANPGWEFKPCTQVYTFGQHNKHDFGNNHRPLYRYMKRGTELYPNAVKIPSWRQLNGDRRAKSGGRVPGDVINFIREAPQADMVREIELLRRERDFLFELRRDANEHCGRDWRISHGPDGVRIDDNPYGQTFEEAVWRFVGGDISDDSVFDITRVTGNSGQRRRFSPTQLNESLYTRCIKLCCTSGDTVVDLFAGSGTLGRVAGECGVNALMLEKSRETCDNILADQTDVEEINE